MKFGGKNSKFRNPISAARSALRISPREDMFIKEMRRMVTGLDQTINIITDKDNLQKLQRDAKNNPELQAVLDKIPDLQDFSAAVNRGDTVDKEQAQAITKLLDTMTKEVSESGITFTTTLGKEVDRLSSMIMADDDKKNDQAALANLIDFAEKQNATKVSSVLKGFQGKDDLSEEQKKLIEEQINILKESAESDKVSECLNRQIC